MKKGDVLVDTKVLLFWFFKAERIIKRKKELKTKGLFVSPISIWEITIKNQIGNLHLPKSIEDFAVDILEHFDLLDQKLEDYIQYSRLPLIHRDPFDRMLIAQSLARNLTLLTTDSRLADYKLSNIELL